MDIGSGTSLHQKRLLAFINHFIIKNVQFLNNFSSQCETRLINFEVKMNKLEGSLKILESQLNSIPDIQEIEAKLNKETTNNEKKNDNDVQEESECIAPVPRDPRYEQFFKMIHFGVPLEAVRLKVIQQGLDPTILGEG